MKANGKFFKRKSCAFALALVLLSALPAAGDFDEIVPSPPFLATDLSGETFSSHALQDNKNTTILLFWALRCAPCLQEMDTLESVYQKYKESGLRVLAIEAAGNNPKVIERTLEKLKKVSINPSYPIIPDEEFKLSEKFGVKVTPRTFLIDASGDIVVSFDNFDDKSKQEMLSKVGQLLGPWVPQETGEEPVKATLAVAELATPKSGAEEDRAAFDRARYFADFYTHKGEYEKALPLYEKCLTLDRKNLHVRLRLAEVYGKTGRNTGARDLLRGILREYPGHGEATAMLREHSSGL